MTSDTFVPLDETGYITVSDRIEDVLPKPKFYSAVGNYYEDQKQRLMLDIWSAQGNSLNQCIYLLNDEFALLFYMFDNARH